MLRRPPRSTLFPTRRSSDLGLLRRHCFRLLGASFTGDVRARADQAIVTTGAYALVRHPSYSAGILRSEEHTSELQSHSDLVCRLLLEKKKDRTKLTPESSKN